MPHLGPGSTAAEVLAHLRSLASEENRQGMKRYGIKIDHALGISHGVQRQIATLIKRNHSRAFETLGQRHRGGAVHCLSHC